MDEHLQPLILAQVVVQVLIDGLRLALAQVPHRQTEGLLVVLHQLRLVGVGGTADARRQGVGHGLTVGILLDVDGTHLHRTRLGTSGRQKALLVLAPLATHQVETTEAQHDGLLETSEVHTHETDAGEVVDVAHPLLTLGQGDAELIPAHGQRVAVAQLHVAVAAVGNVGVGGHAVVVGLQVVVTDADTVLEVAFILVQRVVLVDVLHVGAHLVRGIVRLRTVIGIGRVALRVVDALVAVQDAGLGIVEVRAAIVVVVVTGRVVAPGLDERVILHHRAYLVEPILIGTVGTFLVVIQTIETDVLQHTAAGGRGKGVGLRGLLGNLTPLRIAVGLTAIDGHTALVELLAVAQHVLRHFAEVDVEVASILGGSTVPTLVDEGVHQPELHIFYISLLEVGGLQLAHHAAPLLRRVHQRTVGIELRRQIIRATLLRIVGQVEHRQRRGGTIVGGLVAVGVQLLDIDLAHTMVAELLKVALDMAGSEARRTAGEQRVDGVPRQQGTVVARGDVSLVVVVLDACRHTRQRPRLRVDDADQLFRVLEVVQIGSVILRTTGTTCYELGKLARQMYLRGLRHVQQRYLVQYVGQPLRLLLPAQVQTPKGVVQRLLAHCHLGGQRLL